MDRNILKNEEKGIFLQDSFVYILASKFKGIRKVVRRRGHEFAAIFLKGDVL